MKPTIYAEPLISYNKVVDERKITYLHSHDKYELYYLIGGKTKYFVGDETFVLEKGNFIFIPPYTPHSCDSENTLLNERILVMIPSRYFNQLVLPIVKQLSVDKYIYIPEENLHHVVKILNKIMKEYSEERKYKDNMIQIHIMELFIMLERFKRTRKDILNNTDIIINRVSNYIRENYGRTITLEELSIKFGISKEHLSRQFKSILGIGFNDYVTYVRIQNAEKLLKENKISMVEIASQCGFNSCSYFAAVFKKIKGITPYKYSKLFSLYSSN